MTDRALVLAALIVGGAIVATSFQTRQRYMLSAVSNNVAWRMDTWSGQIDICGAVYRPTGPLVNCGVTVVVPGQPQGQAPTPQQGQAPSPPPSEEPSLPPGNPL